MVNVVVIHKLNKLEINIFNCLKDEKTFFRKLSLEECIQITKHYSLYMEQPLKCFNSFVSYITLPSRPPYTGQNIHGNLTNS